MAFTPGELTLAIETSNPSSATPAGAGADRGGPGVALGRVTGAGAEVLGVEFLAPTSRHDDDLMPAIDRLCRRVSATPDRIGRIAVSVGPGGYTALRVAVATAKMIAEARGGLCIAVPTALVVAQRVPAAAGPFAVLLAGKGDSAWAAVFGRDRRMAGSGGGGGEIAGTGGHLVTADDVESLGVRTLVGDRFVPEAIRGRAAGLGIEIVEPVYDPAACLEASAGLPAIDPGALAPIYPREPDAVTLWRKLHGGA